MKLHLNFDLPFTTIVFSYHGKSIKVTNVLVDTGSASTILSADTVVEVGILPLPEDLLHKIRGVGGTEIVYSRFIDFIQVGSEKMESFEVEIGSLDYGFPMNGILGMDFLKPNKAIVNLHELEIQFPNPCEEV